MSALAYVVVVVVLAIGFAVTGADVDDAVAAYVACFALFVAVCIVATIVAVG